MRTPAAVIVGVVALGCAHSPVERQSDKTQNEEGSADVNTNGPSHTPFDFLNSMKLWKSASRSDLEAAVSVVHPKTSTIHFARFDAGDGPSPCPSVAVFLDDQTGLEFALVPGGEYEIGAAPDVGDRIGMRAPRHAVAMSPFLIARCEVPQRVWAKVMNANPSAVKAEDLPVDSVTWAESADFCQRTGLRLPSEVQWECAARGGVRTEFFTGDDISSLLGFANIADRTFSAHRDEVGVWWHDAVATDFDDKYATSSPVATFRPNQFGLFDIIGNVAEWCADSWSVSPDWTHLDPAFVDDATADHVVRGGSWGSDVADLACSARRYQAWGHRGRLRGLRPSAEVTIARQK